VRTTSNNGAAPTKLDSTTPFTPPQAATSEMGADALLVASLAMLALGALTLLLVNSGLRGFDYLLSAGFAKAGATQKSVHDFAKLAKPLLQNLLGTATPFSVKLEHLLLMAILVTLVGMWRSSYAQAELMRREAKRAGAALKKELEAAKGKKGE